MLNDLATLNLQTYKMGGFCNSEFVYFEYIYSYILDFQEKYIQNLT